VEKWRESRLTVRALRVYTDVYGCSRQRGRRRVPIERSRILLFENVVKSPCFSKEGMRLCNWGLFVRVAVHLEGRLAILVRLTYIEEWTSASLVLFAAHDGVHRT